MDKEQIIRAYDQAAEAYLEGRPHDNLRYLDIMTSYLQAGASILDLGCGAGVPIDSKLVRDGFSVHGIDISTRQIALAQQHVPDGRFEVRDMSSLQEGEFSVDAVISLYAIYHTPRETHPVLFRKMHSFLRDGGILFATLGAKDWEGTKENFYGVRMEWSMYGPDMNRMLVGDAGFEILTDEIHKTEGGRHQVVIARKLADK